MTTLSLSQASMPKAQSPNWVAIAALVLTMVGWALSGLADNTALKERVTKVETKIDAYDHRLERIEAKIDRLLEQQ